MLALTWLVYQPGLIGAFLFDDYATLPSIADRGEVGSLEEAKRFVLAGNAGPSGRPIALASFLLDDDGWPSQPDRFKRTNLYLHLLCGLLVAWLAKLSLTALRWPADRANWAGALSAGIWLLHPLLVSTTLYVVQRMTILSAWFTLCGIAIHIRLRLALVASPRPIALLVVMAAQLAMFTLLAFLSKENGALLPLLVAVVEATILSQVGAGSRPGLFRAWSRVVLGAPALLVLGYLGYSAMQFGAQGEAYRGFTIAQRLMTEGRVLVTYLYALAMPRVETGGLYHDDFTVSTGLLTPATTAMSWAPILIAIGAAWIKRRDWPLVSCAILFFFTGHVLESTVLPIEIYFEHRNYLPAVFLAIAAAVGLTHFDRRLVAAVASAVVVTVLAMLCWQRASLWGNTDTMLLFWAQKQPASERAQLEAAQVELRHNQIEAAVRRLNAAAAQHPTSVPLLTVRLSALCATGQDRRTDVDDLAHALSSAPYGPNTLRAVELLLDAKSIQSCKSMQPDDGQRLARALQQNPTVIHSPRALQQAFFLEGLADAHNGLIDPALSAFTASLEAGYEFEPAMRMVAELASSGGLEQALQLLDAVEQREKSPSMEQQLDMKHLREEIVHDRNSR